MVIPNIPPRVLRKIKEKYRKKMRVGKSLTTSTMKIKSSTLKSKTEEITISGLSHSIWEDAWNSRIDWSSILWPSKFICQCEYESDSTIVPSCSDSEDLNVVESLSKLSVYDSSDTKKKKSTVIFSSSNSSSSSEDEFEDDTTLEPTVVEHPLIPNQLKKRRLTSSVRAAPQFQPPSLKENGQTELVNTSSLAPKAQKDSYIGINQVTPDVSPENTSPNGVPGALQCIWLAMVVAAASLALAIKHYRSAK